MSNGSTNGGPDGLPPELPQILEALEAVYNPRSSNDTRQSATLFLDQAKQSPHAFAHGFALAGDTNKDPTLRHFGLSMMAYHLRYVYQGGGDAILRDYVLQLAHGIREQDPVFLRNKVAQIWCEVAKRVWGLSWLDMDEQLLKLWQASFTGQEFVLLVLEGLSDDIYNQDDYVAALRIDLGSCFSRICTTPEVAELQLPSSAEETFIQLRCGQEGWIMRLGEQLKWSCNTMREQGSGVDRNVQTVAIRNLAALRSILAWISPKSVQWDSCLEPITIALVMGDSQVRVVSSFMPLRIHTLTYR
jgi:exportin-5